MASWKKASQRKGLLCHPGWGWGNDMIGHEALICTTSPIMEVNTLDFSSTVVAIGTAKPFLSVRLLGNSFPIWLLSVGTGL